MSQINTHATFRPLLHSVSAPNLQAQATPADAFVRTATTAGNSQLAPRAPSAGHLPAPGALHEAPRVPRGLAALPPVSEPSVREALQVLQSQVDPITSEVPSLEQWKVLLHHPNPVVRGVALTLDVAEVVPSSTSAALLWDGMHDPNASVRAIATLGYTTTVRRTREGTDLLLSMLEDSDQESRVAAFTCLSAWHDASGQEPDAGTQAALRTYRATRTGSELQRLLAYEAVTPENSRFDSLDGIIDNIRLVPGWWDGRVLRVAYELESRHWGAGASA